MALQSIGIGSAANDGTGDPLRTAFDKINDNFNELYVQLGGNSLSNVTFSSNTITNFDTNGDITIATNGTGTLFIDSNVEFRGTATEINTTTLQVEDNLLELNRNSSGGDVDAGFFVNRGNALNSAFFYWNEGEDKFKAVLSSSDDSVTTAVTDTSTATIVANIDATSAAIDTITALSDGRVTVNDSMQIRGGLSINNNDSSSLALSVEGSIDVTDTIDCLSLSASTSVSCADITVVGTVNANIIDAQIFQTSDSTAIQINEGINVSGSVSCADITVVGTVNANIIDAQIFQTSDSTAIQINEGINVSGAIVGASTVTSTGFVGPLTGDVTGNATGTAATVTGAAQTNITSVGTLTALGVSGQTTLTGSFLPAMYTFVATDAVTIAEHAGRTLLLGEVGGNALVTLTLPDATGSGATYKFIVSVTNTSNYVIAVPDAANTIDGVMLYLDEDGTAVTAFPTVAASDTITLNGTTTGGVLGDYLEIVDIAADQYHVRGVMRVPAGSNPVTPFSEAVS